MIEKLREEDLEECGCCGCHHKPTFYGDCRNDAERFVAADEDENGFIVYVAAENFDYAKQAIKEQQLKP